MEDVTFKGKGEIMELPELKAGKDSSELKLANTMMIAGLVMAVASSLGKVPFTPDALSAYLANLVAQATEWSKVLLPYVTAVYAFYLSSRHKLKSKHIEAQKAVAIKKIKSTTTTAVLLALFSLLFMHPAGANAGQMSFGWMANSPEQAVDGYMIHYGPTADNLEVGTVDCGLPDVSGGTMVYTGVFPSSAQCFAVSAYRADANGPISNAICLDSVPGKVAKFKLLMFWGGEHQD